MLWGSAPTAHEHHGAVPPCGAMSTPCPPHGTWAWSTAGRCHPSAEGHGPPAQAHLPARRRRRVQRAVPWRLLTSQVSGPAAPRPTRSSRRQCWSSSGITTSHVPSCSPSTCPPLREHQLSHHGPTGSPRPTTPSIAPTSQPHGHLPTHRQPWPRLPPRSPHKQLAPHC